MEEEMFFTSADGLKLCGILQTPATRTNKCVAMCHGLSTQKNEWHNTFKRLSQMLVDAGFATFRFDFRGHGDSKGKSVDMTVSGEVMDLDAAVNLVHERGYTNLGMIGCSFGGGIISLYCGSNPEAVKSIVLWCPLIDYSDWYHPISEMAKLYLGKPAFDRAEKDGYIELFDSKFKIGRNLFREMLTFKPYQELAKVKVPILFVHSDGDRYVSYKIVENYSKLIENSSLVTVDAVDHGFTLKKDFEIASKATADFFIASL